MRKCTLLARQGILFKLIYVLFQNLIVSPILLLLSFFVSVVITNFHNTDSVLIIKISFVILNIIWIIRNSLVKIYDDKIIVRSLIGTKQIIDTDNITELRIIDYKELRNIIFETQKINPLISNCCAILIPFGKFITFKNKLSRDVVIGVWNYEKLYELLANKISKTDSNTECFNNLPDKQKKSIENSFGKSIFTFFVKMPLVDHIILFFKHFYETLLLPLGIVLILKWLFGSINISIGNYFYLIIFLFICSFEYYNIVKIIIDTKSKVIKLNLFIKNDKNVIKYETLSNLTYINSFDVIDNNTKKDTEKLLISTPYSKKNNTDKVISFDLKNNISVALSVNKPQKFYDLLNNQ